MLLLWQMWTDQVWGVHAAAWLRGEWQKEALPLERSTRIAA